MGRMPLDDVRKKHDEAWNRLFELVKLRNNMLRRVGRMAEFAAEFSPATSMFIEFDYDKARELLGSAEAMGPLIDAALEHYNELAKQIARPQVDKKKSPEL